MRVRIISVALIVVVLSYLIFAFVEWELDPGLWPEISRVLLGIHTAFVLGFAIFLMIESSNVNANPAKNDVTTEEHDIDQ